MQEVIMSLTPMEVITQRSGVRKARGNVLIGGLGMGWLTRRVCEKKNVKRVTVCEINPAIADFFGRSLVKEFRHLDIEVVDVYDHLDTELYVYDTILMDIWPSTGGAGYDKKFRDLVVAHPRVWGWMYHPDYYDRMRMEREYQTQTV
jgi:spermidine synthase